MNPAIVARVLWQRRVLMGHDRFSREQILAFQAERLARLRAHAYAHSPFYQAFHAGRFEAPLAALPPLTKAMVMADFDALATDRAVRRADVEAHLRTLTGDERYLGRYWVNATSGSTGAPGLFLFDEGGWAGVIAASSRLYEWAGAGFRLGHRRRIAIVASRQPWHMSARVGATLPAWWTPTLPLDARMPMDDIVDRLNAWQPETVIAYASVAAALALEQREGRLAIHPSVLAVSSEVLTPAMRRAVEAAWGPVLFEAYAATESGTLAAECPEHRGLHLMEDVAVVEVVDADDRPVPAGEWGDKLLVTPLFNRVQPLIRYELSDMLMIAPEPCPCGRPFPLIAGIRGRREEVLLLRTPEGQIRPLHPNVFHAALDMAPVGGWQLVQTAGGLRLLLQGAGPSELRERLAEAVHHALAEAGAGPVALEVVPVAEIPRTRSGKAPLIRVESAEGGAP